METIFNALVEWILIINKQGSIQFANYALLKWLRCNQQDIYAKQLEEIIHISLPCDEKIKELKGSNVFTQVEVSNEYGEYLKADITLKDEMWMGQDALIMVIKEQLNPIYTKGILESFLDSIPEGICIKNEESKPIYVNKSYAQLTNVGKEDLLGSIENDFFEEDKEVLSTQRPNMLERMLGPKGEEKWYQTFKVPLNNLEGQAKYIGVIINDITLIKKIELELLNRLDELKTLERCIQDAKEYKDDMEKFLSSLDKDILKYFNANSLSIWIYDEIDEQLNLHTKLGKVYEKLQDVKGISISKQKLNQARSEVRYGKSTHVMKRAGIISAKVFIENNVEYVSTYSIEYNNKILGFLSIGYAKDPNNRLGKEDFAKALCAQLGLIIRNSNLKKRVQKELHKIEKLEKDKQIEKMKNEFFANISHEFRTPLNIILATMQLMDKCMEDGSMYTTTETDIKRYIQNIRQNSYRLLRLVNNLIDITRIDTGYYRINLDNYNIVEVVEDITLSVVQYVQNKGITLIFDTEVEEKIIACDPDKIERIMLNLLSNAIKYTNQNGEVKVDIKINNSKVQIIIKDNGIGIPKEQIDTIFNRFIQVSDLLTRQHEGSGIGLSLVKSLVEMHEGDIIVDSELGRGTEFTIELPIRVIEDTKKVKINHHIMNNQIEKCNIEFSDIYGVKV